MPKPLIVIDSLYIWSGLSDATLKILPRLLSQKLGEHTLVLARSKLWTGPARKEWADKIDAHVRISNAKKGRLENWVEAANGSELNPEDFIREHKDSQIVVISAHPYKSRFQPHRGLNWTRNFLAMKLGVAATSRGERPKLLLLARGPKRKKPAKNRRSGFEIDLSYPYRPIEPDDTWHLNRFMAQIEKAVNVKVRSGKTLALTE